MVKSASGPGLARKLRLYSSLLQSGLCPGIPIGVCAPPCHCRLLVSCILCYPALMLRICMLSTQHAAFMLLSAASLCTSAACAHCDGQKQSNFMVWSSQHTSSPCTLSAVIMKCSVWTTHPKPGCMVWWTQGQSHKSPQTKHPAHAASLF